MQFLSVVNASRLSDDLRAIYDAEVDNIVNSLRRLGARGADLEDLTQEVFVRAFQQLPSFDRQRPIRPWLFGIAFRVFSEMKRDGWKMRPTAGGDFRDFDLAPDPGLGPERAAETRQARELVLAALQELVPERRAVFVMYELNGDSMADIAEALGIPLFTAYSRLRVARAQFANLIRSAQSTGRDGLQ